jgi:hypothetical protein
MLARNDERDRRSRPLLRDEWSSLRAPLPTAASLPGWTTTSNRGRRVAETPRLREEATVADRGLCRRGFPQRAYAPPRRRLLDADDPANSGGLCLRPEGEAWRGVTDGSASSAMERERVSGPAPPPSAATWMLSFQSSINSVAIESAAFAPAAACWPPGERLALPDSGLALGREAVGQFRTVVRK